MELSCILNENKIKEIYKTYISRAMRWREIVCFGMIAAAILLSVGMKAKGPWAAVYGILGVALACILYFSNKKLVKTLIARFHETAKDGKCEYFYVFEESTIRMENRTTGAKIDLAYEGLAKYMEMGSMAAVITKTGVFIPIDKADGREKHLAEFLKAKNPKLKIKKKN